MKTTSLTLVQEHNVSSNTDLAERVKQELSEIKFQFVNDKTARVTVTVEVVDN